VDHWLDISNRNLKLAASAVQHPDCYGYLMKLGHRWKAWKRRYCVLKDACLYFYQDNGSDGALGTCYLHFWGIVNWYSSVSKGTNYGMDGRANISCAQPSFKLPIQ